MRASETFLGHGPQVGPAMGDAWRRRAGHSDLGDVSGAEQSLDDSRQRGAADAVRTRVFRMHRGVVDRLPSRLRGYRRIAAQIAVSNCGDGPPEVIMILAIHHGDVGVCFRHGDECHKSCAIHDVHFPGHDQLARDRMVGHGSGNQPEPRIFGSGGRSAWCLLCRRNP